MQSDTQTSKQSSRGEEKGLSDHCQKPFFPIMATNRGNKWLEHSQRNEENNWTKITVATDCSSLWCVFSPMNSIGSVALLYLYVDNGNGNDANSVSINGKDS